MQKQTIHKEIYDPFAHYTRGILFFDRDRYTFTAHRMPYVDLNDRTWKTEQAFNADYQRLIDRKYSF